MTACLPPRPGPGLLPASAPRRPRSPGRRFSSSSSPLPAKLSDHPPFSLEHALARCCCPHALPRPAAQWPGPLTVPCPSLGRCGLPGWERLCVITRRAGFPGTLGRRLEREGHFLHVHPGARGLPPGSGPLPTFHGLQKTPHSPLPSSTWLSAAAPSPFSASSLMPRVTEKKETGVRNFFREIRVCFPILYLGISVR